MNTNRSVKGNKPIIAVGIDVASPEFIEKWTREGHLPTISSLINVVLGVEFTPYQIYPAAPYGQPSSREPLLPSMDSSLHICNSLMKLIKLIKSMQTR